VAAAAARAAAEAAALPLGDDEEDDDAPPGEEEERSLGDEAADGVGPGRRILPTPPRFTGAVAAVPEGGTSMVIVRRCSFT